MATEKSPQAASVNEPRTHPLGTLIAELEGAGLLRSVLAGAAPTATVAIDGITLDSRRVERGTLFAALPGQHADGVEFVGDAVARGAAAVLAERASPAIGIPQLLVHAGRPALALSAAWFNGFPSESLGIVGITGTDGKTTTSYLIRSMLQAAGLPTGLIGTIDVVAAGTSLGNAARATSPEAPDLQGYLARMVAGGDRFAVVESTSHGLAQDRLAFVAYDVAVLTNVTHEHLEFHRTIEAYRAAKRRLFEALATSEHNPDKGWGKHAVLNVDDPISTEYAVAAREAGAEVHLYGSDSAAAIRAVSVREDAKGLRLTVSTTRWQSDVLVHLPGRFNVANALAAIGVGEALDLDPAQIRAGIEAVESVPGRMQRIDAGQPFTVVVDYAHTPDSLAKVLDNLAPLSAAGGGGLIAVFGSAGDRDTAKRPMMGRVAAERTRLMVVTDEDPRSEDRVVILEEIAAGAMGRRRGQDLLLIADRREAIGAAISAARPGDVVVLCGKGHEKTIEYADGDVPWDEAGAARDALAELGYSG
jgi:UDP-N-acetylmuramoyl-L-alanyl-D-glutamate--2,6-diaminopimelate ligase